MPAQKHNLSENLEDYLEAISSLSGKGGAVRPSDIASELKVKRPSVTAALNSLADKGLVEYEKYRPVTLTKEGREHAAGIQKKHALLRSFFTDILGVDASEADIVACKMEHVVNDGIMRKLSRFVKGFSPCGGCADGDCSKCAESHSLADLKVGDAGIILCIDKSLGDLACFAGMGLVIGSRVEVVRVAPLGDPAVLKVRGAEISLRKSQLAAVKVKRV